MISPICFQLACHRNRMPVPTDRKGFGFKDRAGKFTVARFLSCQTLVQFQGQGECEFWIIQRPRCIKQAPQTIGHCIRCGIRNFIRSVCGFIFVIVKLRFARRNQQASKVLGWLHQRDRVTVRMPLRNRHFNAGLGDLCMVNPRAGCPGGIALYPCLRFRLAVLVNRNRNRVYDLRSLCSKCQSADGPPCRAIPLHPVGCMRV